MNYLQGFNFGLMNSGFSIMLDWFHNFCCSFFFGVLFFVCVCSFYLMLNLFVYKGYGDSYRFCEFFGSFVPIGILFLVMFPSLGLLYQYGMTGGGFFLSVGVIGHQWYWSYEYGGLGDDFSFDSYMLSIDDLEMGGFRLLEVDNRCVIPGGVSVSFYITSDDVIHSWSVYSVGLKVDAISGVINQLTCSFPLLGVFYGQCSEICGAYHSFMPVVLEVTLLDNFVSWVLGN